MLIRINQIHLCLVLRQVPVENWIKQPEILLDFDVHVIFVFKWAIILLLAGKCVHADLIEAWCLLRHFSALRGLLLYVQKVWNKWLHGRTNVREKSRVAVTAQSRSVSLEATFLLGLRALFTLVSCAARKDLNLRWVNLMRRGDVWRRPSRRQARNIDRPDGLPRLVLVLLKLCCQCLFGAFIGVSWMLLNRLPGLNQLSFLMEIILSPVDFNGSSSFVMVFRDRKTTTFSLKIQLW